MIHNIVMIDWSLIILLISVYFYSWKGIEEFL